MTPQQAKKFLPVITAFAEGKTIQLKSSSGKEWIDMTSARFDGPDEIYRIKPDTIILKYRRYIRKDHKGFYVASISQNLGKYADINKIEKMSRFVRWIDTDWVTYECEV